MNCTIQSFSNNVTVCCFNCGGAQDRERDYFQMAVIEDLMEQRKKAEPNIIENNQNIQNYSFRRLLTNDLKEYQIYSNMINQCILNYPDLKFSNLEWLMKLNDRITPFQMDSDEIPFKECIYNSHTKEKIQSHIAKMTNDAHPISKKSNNLLDESQIRLIRKKMAEKIFKEQLNHDIICLQEANSIARSMFPDNYEVVFQLDSHFGNGLAWNKNRFELEEICLIPIKRIFAVQLYEIATGIRILVATGHLQGCHPFYPIYDERTRTWDSTRGDNDLLKLINFFEESTADLKVLGMDLNVTALHPRMNILIEAGFELGDENDSEYPSCTNPFEILDTRIDRIAFKTNRMRCKIHSIPVIGIRLNDPTTNFSDHIPIAAEISYQPLMS